MPVTHADLAPGPRRSDLGSRTGVFLMVLSIFLGLLCFILCLFAEANRSEMSWLNSNGKGEGGKGECVYSGSGKIPLLCGAGAFLVLAIAMVVQHTFLLIAVSSSASSPLVTWDPDSDFAKTIACQAAFFFIATWISYAVGEILLLIGLSVESGHLKNWGTPRNICLTIGEGLFTAAGVFGLVTVFLAVGLYVTALRAERLVIEQENMRREIIETSMFYASPPRSPRHIITAVANENPIFRQYQNDHSLSQYLTEFEKYTILL